MDKYDPKSNEIELKINASQSDIDYLKSLENWERNSKKGRLCGKIFLEIDSRKYVA